MGQTESKVVKAKKRLRAVAESDDHLFAKFVEGSAISEAELMQGIRKATIAQKIFPVICGSAFKNKGVQNLLDAVVDYLPSPVIALKATSHYCAVTSQDGCLNVYSHTGRR